MAKQVKKDKPKAAPKKQEAPKEVKDVPVKAEPVKAEKPKAEKVVSTKRMSDPNKVVDRSSFAIEKSVLLKDFGKQKKGDPFSGHPNTMDMLRKKGIVE